MPNKKKRTTAFQEGYQAFKLKGPSVRNPYGSMTDKGKHWVQGAQKAMDELILPKAA